ncbi:hypothetical protein [Ancylomarina sp. 16SWW S1-10-2]|uniref:NifB/NifX family molybdenum-iron cluster-binding protein n=1 Tax=Ancylomarina sp. 16SWW S1-10-2 TaxID=2499681 RepID=UPI0012ADE779|nr:hypothetical protein [Ancylomarina sp. 16SWW S1-10-2]MRT92509.1 hypothetical protein [Ancylomarina sp. 16SWW S1-10-2]
MKRIAIPIERGKLSEYFGNCNHFEIFEIDERFTEKNRLEVPFKLKTELPNWLASEGVTDVIMYKIDKLILKMFQTHKMNLFIGVRIDYPNNIINDYIDGKLYSDDTIISEIIDDNE